MTGGPTFASVTNEPCACGALQRCNEDPSHPIKFDPETGEYHFNHRELDGKGEGQLIIYHCPFCGGCAPRSRRHLLFAVIPQAEAARLAAILQEITTIEAALEVLGNPDLDQMARRARSEKDGLPPEVELYRLLVYQ